MEYCDSLELGVFHGKRRTQIVAGFIAVTLLVGTLEGLLELRSMDQYTFYESIKSQVVDHRQIWEDGGAALNLRKSEGVGVENTETLQINLVEGTQLESVGGQVANSVSDIPVPQVYGEATLAQGGSPALEAPEISQTPELEGSGTVLEDLVVPAPSIQDVPKDPPEEANPDISGDTNLPGTYEIEGFLVDEAGIIYGYNPSADLALTGILTLPKEGCSGIAKGTFDTGGADIYEIYIPPNITYIEPGVLSDLSNLGWIELEGQNATYECFEGILYDRTMTTIVAFPPARVGQYSIPKFTAKLGDYSFSGTQLSKLDMRNCGLMEVGNNVFDERDVSGLKIVAPREYIEEYRVAFDKTSVLIE